MLADSKTIGEGTARIELISRIIQEVNNQLTTVVGYSQMLANNVIDKDLKKDADAIFTGASKASKALQQIQSLLQEHEPAMKMADLNELIQESLRIFGNRLEPRNIHVIANLDPNVKTMLIDPDQIQRVFLILLDIAEHAMIEADGKGTLYIATKKLGNKVHVQISDDGLEIHGKDLQGIVQSVNLERNRVNKEALGLLICREMINNHGGHILVDSESGKGTFFFIELPISAQEIVNDIKVMQDNKPLHFAGRKGLIIDDDVYVTDLLVRLLKAKGLETEKVYDGELALERLDKNSYDFILLDIIMPKLDGVSLYRKLKEKGSPCTDKIIFVTGDIVSADTKELLRSIKNPIITKPFDLEEIWKTILQVLNPI